MKIGERIRAVFDHKPKDCNIDWFAARLHCDRRNIYRIFARENIDIKLLARISEILGHDFFADLSELLARSAGEITGDNDSAKPCGEDGAANRKPTDEQPTD